MVTFIYN